MKYLVFLLTFFIFVSANNIKNEKKDKISEKKYLKLEYKKQLSKKELAYQKYQEKLEKENQKLEDDGFCSCNNN